MTDKYYRINEKGLWADHPEYPGIHTPEDLYNALCEIWCEYTCTPRMRQNWSEKNRTLGQCSITAFAAQDLFGGEVLGIPLEDGGFHCFNKVDEHVFDLTSAQFETQLDYENCSLQSRDVHFARKEKLERYRYLKNELKKRCSRSV